MSVLQISLKIERDIQLSQVMQKDPSLGILGTDRAFRELGFRAMDAIVPIESVKLAEKDTKV